MSIDNERKDRVLEALARCVVWHPDFARAYAVAEKSINATKNRRASSSMMLLGDTGVGKSTLCRRIEREIGINTSLDTVPSYILTKPCLLVEMPTDASIKSVAIELLSHLGLKDSERLQRFSSTSLTRMIIQRLIVCKTRLIILDEFHRLVDQGSPQTKKTVCRWVNQLLNETQLPIMLAGLPTIEALINSIPELSDRYPYRTYLRYFDFTDKVAISQFYKVIELIEEKVIKPAGFTEQVVLTEEFIFKGICFATNGSLRHVNMLFNDSLTLALTREDNKLTLEDFARAADGIYFCRACNPFRLSARELKAAMKKQYE